MPARSLIALALLSVSGLPLAATDHPQPPSAALAAISKLNVNVAKPLAVAKPLLAKSEDEPTPPWRPRVFKWPNGPAIWEMFPPGVCYTMRSMMVKRIRPKSDAMRFLGETTCTESSKIHLLELHTGGEAGK